MNDKSLIVNPGQLWERKLKYSEERSQSEGSLQCPQDTRRLLQV